MDESVRPEAPKHGHHRWQAASLAMLLFALLPVQARQALPDPTKPAIGVIQPLGGADNPGGPHLQSILISPKRKLAVINGQTLHVGDTFGNAVVVKISAQEVVLKSGGELQVLKLFPDVEKRKSSAGKAASQKVKDR